MCKDPNHSKSEMTCFRCGAFICPECAVYATYEKPWPDGFCERLVCDTHFKPGKGIRNIPEEEKERFWRTWLRPGEKRMIGDEKLIVAIRTVENVLDSMGIYPAAYPHQNEDGEWVQQERTEWQDGWNACNMEVSDKIYEKLEALTEEYDKNLAVLAILDIGWQDKDEFFLNMNDTFCFACADCEPITKEEAKEVVTLLLRYGLKGVDYWVAEKRGYDPEIPRYRERVRWVREQEKPKEG